MIPHYYHGTLADLRSGDLIEPGHGPNLEGSRPGRVYFVQDDPAWAHVHAFVVGIAQYGWDYLTPEMVQALVQPTETPLPGEMARPRIYEVWPKARRTHPDFSRYFGLPVHARWSDGPLTVIEELPLDPVAVLAILRQMNRWSDT